MNYNEKIAWIRLIKTPKIGRVTFFGLLKKFNTAENAINELPNYLKKLNKPNNFVIPSIDYANKLLNECIKQNIHLICSCEKEYPRNFLNTNDFSPILFCKGNINLLNKPKLAVVGSRNASLQGISLTKKLIKDLDDLIIVSGLAKGIDTSAHEAALLKGTIAVLGCGLNIIYPEENTELYKKILENNGLIISELGLTQEPRPNLFNYRNRIISGISNGVLVIEAAMQSGSLITAKYALDQGRTVMAVPGHPYDLRSYGTNYLIQNGANLIQTSKDIISSMQAIHYEQNNLFENYSILNEENIEDIKKYLLENLGSAFMSINEIIKISQFNASQIQSALCELELMGLVEIERNSVKKIH